ncbi:MAG TPA: hypothetical protein VLC47_11685 [Burkholderiales bacterium]|nr:hypothetical protein [Burkholderiales bacterium]
MLVHHLAAASLANENAVNDKRPSRRETSRAAAVKRFWVTLAAPLVVLVVLFVLQCFG